MTPKEKAESLVKKYRQICKVSTLGSAKPAAIEAAFILVNEILLLDDFSVEGRSYWAAVQKELKSF